MAMRRRTRLYASSRAQISVERADGCIDKQMRPSRHERHQSYLGIAALAPPRLRQMERGPVGIGVGHVQRRAVHGVHGKPSPGVGAGVLTSPMPRALNEDLFEWPFPKPLPRRRHSGVGHMTT